MLEKIKATASFISKKIKAKPEIGIILGTGLGGLVKEIEIIESIPYSEILRMSNLVQNEGWDGWN